MDESRLEFNKSVLIIVLLLLCVFQMGILWNDVNPGIPVLFSSQALRTKLDMINVDEIKGMYIRPEKILVSDGTGDYWPLSSKHDLYNAIWYDFEDNYFKQIVQQKPVGENAYAANWDWLSKMKCIIIEFKNPVPMGIIHWLTGTDDAVISPVKKIYKIAVFPSEEIVNNKNTLYLTDDGQTVYKYIVTIEQGNMKKEDYIKAIETIGDNDSIIPVSRLSTYHPSINNDNLLVNLSEDKKQKIIWDLLVKSPDPISLHRNNIDRIQELLLGHGSMYTMLSKDGSNVIFSDDEKFVRYYQNGFFDYRYRKRNIGVKGAVEEALGKALAFIETRRKNLIDKARIYLDNIDDTNEDYYVFTFNYVVDDMEVKVLDDRNNTVKPAIIITADRDRVLDAKWYIKTFDYNDFSYHYNLYFYDFYENQLLEEYPALSDTLSIKNISMNYLYSENGMRAEPYWLVETDQDNIYLRMWVEGE